MEGAWIDFEQLQDYGEGLIKHVIKTVLEKHKEDLQILKGILNL